MCWSPTTQDVCFLALLLYARVKKKKKNSIVLKYERVVRVCVYREVPPLHATKDCPFEAVHGLQCGVVCGGTNKTHPMIDYNYY